MTQTIYCLLVFCANNPCYSGVQKDNLAKLSCGYNMNDEKLTVTFKHPLHRIIFERIEDSCEEIMPIYLSEPVRTRTSEVITTFATKEEPDLKVDKKSKVKEAHPKSSNNNCSDDRKVRAIDASASDEQLLFYLVQAEAGNTEDLDGCRLVCDVVLNRVRSNLFPNTVRDVIFQTGQFSVANKIAKAENGDTDTTRACSPNDKVIQAVRMELTNGQLDSESLYFARSPITSVGVYQHGRHFFSR